MYEPVKCIPKMDSFLVHNFSRSVQVWFTVYKKKFCSHPWSTIPFGNVIHLCFLCIVHVAWNESILQDFSHLCGWIYWVHSNGFQYLAKKCFRVDVKVLRLAALLIKRSNECDQIVVTSWTLHFKMLPYDVSSRCVFFCIAVYV